MSGASPRSRAVGATFPSSGPGRSSASCTSEPTRGRGGAARSVRARRRSGRHARSAGRPARPTGKETTSLGTVVCPPSRGGRADPPTTGSCSPPAPRASCRPLARPRPARSARVARRANGRPGRPAAAAAASRRSCSRRPSSGRRCRGRRRRHRARCGRSPWWEGADRRPVRAGLGAREHAHGLCVAARGSSPGSPLRPARAAGCGVREVDPRGAPAGEAGTERAVELGARRSRSDRRGAR